MTDQRAGFRYAGALFALAKDKNEIERIEEEFAQAIELVVRHPEITNLLVNTTISREEKEDFIGKIFPADSSPLFLNFIRVLVRKKRFRELFSIREQFHRLYEAEKGLQRVRVHSPIPFDEFLRGRLRQVLEKRLKRKVYLEIETDPQLLGGMVLDFDGNRIDASYRTALFELKQTLRGNS